MESIFRNTNFKLQTPVLESSTQNNNEKKKYLYRNLFVIPKPDF